MKCDFCGAVFEQDESKKGCSGCPMSKSCGKIKCPKCNYEMLQPPEHKLLKNIKRWVKRFGSFG